MGLVEDSMEETKYMSVPCYDIYTGGVLLVPIGQESRGTKVKDSNCVAPHLKNAAPSNMYSTLKPSGTVRQELRKTKEVIAWLGM